MKKIVTLIVTSAVAASIATSAAANTNMTGFYIGVNAGYGAGKDKAHISNNKGINIKKDKDLKGAVGGLHFGYQQDFGQFVAGLEGSTSLSDTKASITSGTRARALKATFKRKHSLGVAGRLGVKLNNWLAYVKLGYENATFSRNLNKTFGVVGSGSKSKRLNAFVPGIGFETLICDHVMLGGEWTYSLYSGKNFNDKVGKGKAKAHISDKHTPQIGDFKLRLGYKF
jgi:opacity protein-like surface antigen